MRVKKKENENFFTREQFLKWMLHNFEIYVFYGLDNNETFISSSLFRETFRIFSFVVKDFLVRWEFTFNVLLQQFARFSLWPPIQICTTSFVAVVGGKEGQMKFITQLETFFVEIWKAGKKWNWIRTKISCTTAENRAVRVFHNIAINFNCNRIGKKSFLCLFLLGYNNFRFLSSVQCSFSEVNRVHSLRRRGELCNNLV